MASSHRDAVVWNALHDCGKIQAVQTLSEADNLTVESEQFALPVLALSVEVSAGPCPDHAPTAHTGGGGEG
ncbi:MAG TPA: hypothetical protein VMV07_15660, partial [Streptosporangiaceae bacterium]|nr:hypothetical protein [Streptosporangiaceae bacterium]